MIDDTVLNGIYRAYPRHVGSRTAKQAIDRALRRLMDGKEGPMSEGDAVEGLLRATQAFARSPAGRKGNFTPHPATWFNRSSYLDSPEEWHREESKNDSKQLAQAERNAEVFDRVLRGNRKTPETGGGDISRRLDTGQARLLAGHTKRLFGEGD
jgi:hypothetical protein